MDEKAQLTERQKELNCIYRIDKLIAETNDVLTVLSASCGIIADAMQYPCYTSVLIEYDGYSIKSPYFKPGKNKIQSKIFIDNIESGIIYTFYTHKLNNKEIEFLDEEKNLLDSVAARLSDFLLVKKIKNQTNTDESNRTNKFASIRLEILEKAVNEADFQKLGIYRLYLIGSVKNFTSSISSDIDLIIHYDGNQQSKEKIEIWFAAWGKAVISSKKYQNEIDNNEMLFDLHFITKKDIVERNSYAIMTSSLHNSARLIKSTID
jgi:predicted nucleotidyltransferase